MTKDQAERLQKEWKAYHRSDCEHPHSVLERTEEGYLTGGIRCLICGADLGNTGARLST